MRFASGDQDGISWELACASCTTRPPAAGTTSSVNTRPCPSTRVNVCWMGAGFSRRSGRRISIFTVFFLASTQSVYFFVSSSCVIAGRSLANEEPCWVFLSSVRTHATP